MLSQSKSSLGWERCIAGTACRRECRGICQLQPITPTTSIRVSTKQSCLMNRERNGRKKFHCQREKGASLLNTHFNCFSFVNRLRGGRKAKRWQIMKIRECFKPTWMSRNEMIFDKDYWKEVSWLWALLGLLWFGEVLKLWWNFKFYVNFYNFDFDISRLELLNILCESYSVRFSTWDS